MAYSVLVFFVLISNTYPTPTAKPTPTTTTTYPSLATTNSTPTATTVYSNYTVINFPGNADHPANADHPPNGCPQAPTGNISTERWVNDSVKWFLELAVPILTLIVISLSISRWFSSRAKKASHQNADYRRGTIAGGGGGEVENGGNGGGDVENGGNGGGDVENGGNGGGDVEDNGGGGGGGSNLVEIVEVLQGVGN